MKTEFQNLNRIAEQSLYTTFSNVMMIQYCFEIFKRYLKAGTILELGPAEGLMTEKLIGITNKITVVEGSDIFVKNLKEKFPNLSIINSLFENYKPNKRFDNIILGHVLEHVEDPIYILKLAKDWLNDDGVILTAVPNSRSIHRQAAVIMGIQDRENSMSELDFHHGHRRIYNPEMFRGEFKAAGLKISSYGGYWLKPVSNQQIHQTWSEEMLWAFMQLGERYPDIAAEIFVIAQK